METSVTTVIAVLSPRLSYIAPHSIRLTPLNTDTKPVAKAPKARLAPMLTTTGDTLPITAYAPAHRNIAHINIFQNVGRLTVSAVV